MAWSYGAGHPQYGSTNVNGWAQFRNFREAWFGIQYNIEGTHRYETRGGPLISEPATYGGWAGYTSDTQYLETVDLVARPGGLGIGGYSYVFGRIHQQIADLTLRSNILFNRKQSLEIYAQPYITGGDYAEARELRRPDSYAFIHYDEPNYDVHRFDFSYASVNTNIVYRWEYRPGSTFFLVWTQSRSDYQERWSMPPGTGEFRNNINTRNLFRTEPENRILAKVSYWLPI